MENLDFRKWILDEVGTSTACVASFKRMALPMRRRDWLGHWGAEDPFFKKKKKKREVD